MKPTYKKLLKRLSWYVISLFLLMNVVAWFHAYKFTHFSDTDAPKTKDGAKLSLGDKIKTIVLGISNPRPENKKQPDTPYKTIVLNSNKKIACWYKQAARKKGTVILFHGYSGSKAGLLVQAGIFNSLGYNILLVDFMGSGGSEGNQTTIGFYESQEVKTAYDFIQAIGETNIILYGTSMGAVAIMKCQQDFKLNAQALIVECPFGSMLQTVEARFHTMHVPSFPMAELLVFWGGVQNDFNAFNHNPVDYAPNINTPTLLLYGAADDKVSRAEIDGIYKNIRGSKHLIVYPLAGHDDYLKLYRTQWTANVTSFLANPAGY